jgi:hypothetical protein
MGGAIAKMNLKVRFMISEYPQAEIDTVTHKRLARGRKQVSVPECFNDSLNRRIAMC